MVPQQFEERLRQRLLSTQLSRLVAASELVTERELVEAVRLLRQKRADLALENERGAEIAREHPAHPAL